MNPNPAKTIATVAGSGTVVTLSNGRSEAVGFLMSLIWKMVLVEPVFSFVNLTKKLNV